MAAQTKDEDNDDIDEFSTEVCVTSSISVALLGVRQFSGCWEIKRSVQGYRVYKKLHKKSGYLSHWDI